MKVSRRTMFTGAAAAPLAGMGFPLGGEVDAAMVGVMIRIAWTQGGWHVMVPDWESTSEYWVPGMAVLTKWVPMAEYLAGMEDEFRLVARS